MRYLPDTNILIRAIDGFEPEASFLKKQVEEARIVMSVIAIAEFYPGASEDELKAFNKLVDMFGVINIDRITANIAGKYRKQLLKKTTRNSLIDCFLAAQAKVNNLILVTNNLADFPMKDIKVISP